MLRVVFSFLNSYDSHPHTCTSIPTPIAAPLPPRRFSQHVQSCPVSHFCTRRATLLMMNCFLRSIDRFSRWMIVRFSRQRHNNMIHFKFFSPFYSTRFNKMLCDPVIDGKRVHSEGTFYFRNVRESFRIIREFHKPNSLQIFISAPSRLFRILTNKRIT